jgi:hypothetical protein
MADGFYRVQYFDANHRWLAHDGGNSRGMMRLIEFVAEDESITARAALWEDRAPQTCKLVWEMLPVTAYFHHAIYSGSEVAMMLPTYMPMGEENATYIVETGEIGFLSLQAKNFFEVDADFSEIAFFYGRGARPSMMEGPVRLNLFAHFVSGEKELYALCYRMRKEGQKRFTIRRVE